MKQNFLSLRTLHRVPVDTSDTATNINDGSHWLNPNPTPYTLTLTLHINPNPTDLTLTLHTNPNPTDINDGSHWP